MLYVLKVLSLWKCTKLKYEVEVEVDEVYEMEV